MTKDELQKQVLEALSSGVLHPTTIIMGDNVQNKIEKVESGGVVNITGGQMEEQAQEGMFREEPAPAEKPYTPPIPREGDYNGVRLYIEERKKYDQDFKTFCQNHNRKDLCSFLTKQFGWFVDDNSLCQNIRRNM